MIFSAVVVTCSGHDWCRHHVSFNGLICSSKFSFPCLAPCHIKLFFGIQTMLIMPKFGTRLCKYSQQICAREMVWGVHCSVICNQSFLFLDIVSDHSHIMSRLGDRSGILLYIFIPEYHIPNYSYSLSQGGWSVSQHALGNLKKNNDKSITGINQACTVWTFWHRGYSQNCKACDHIKLFAMGTAVWTKMSKKSSNILKPPIKCPNAA